MVRKHQGLPHTIKPTTHQTGRSVVNKDRPRDAMLPGKRISRNGLIYWETRKNRSDLKNRRT